MKNTKKTQVTEEKNLFDNPMMMVEKMEDQYDSIVDTYEEFLRNFTDSQAQQEEFKNVCVKSMQNMMNLSQMFFNPLVKMACDAQIASLRFFGTQMRQATQALA